MESHVSGTKSLNRQRAADQLVAFVEKSILEGALTPGNALPPEREIVETHGVSRTVVREALRTLCSKGLIVARPGYRPIVAKPGYDGAVMAAGSIVAQLLGQPGGVGNLFDLRTRMEASLVREAAQSATALHLERLEAALEDNRAAIGQSAQFYQSDTAFHGILYEVPNNPVLPSIHRAYTDWLSPQWSKMPRSPTRNETNYQAHKAIVDGILRRDADRAEAALRDHLDFAWAQVKETFEDIE